MNPGDREPYKGTEDLPLDARLLSEAVIELNISRRSVGLYPPGHAIITSAIKRAYDLLERLFEIRPAITLGIARDALVVDEFLLDTRNPVYRECAQSFFRKGLAGVTFRKGLSVEELTHLHELLTAAHIRSGTQFVEEARNLTHISAAPVDYDAFRFVEDRFRTPEGTDSLWADYVYGLLRGQLTTEESEAAVLSVPPEEVARVLSDLPGTEAEGEAYDRVITTYLNEKGGPRLNQEAYARFLSMVNNLAPTVKGQFLERAREHTDLKEDQIGQVLKDMTSEQFETIATGFMENATLIPPTLKNVVDKLGEVHKDRRFAFEMFQPEGAVFHDIPLGQNLATLFNEDHFADYVKDDYRDELEAFLRRPLARSENVLDIRDECSDENIDRITTEIMIETMDTADIPEADYLQIVTRLAEFAGLFVDTGRFEDTLSIYNAVYGHSLNSPNSGQARDTLTYYFQSPAFIERLVRGALAWGRRDREGLFRLARIMRSFVTEPLLVALKEEKDAANRKLILSLISSFGSDVAHLLVPGLKDDRWYVVRNMLLLLRACNGKQYAEEVERYAKHDHPMVSIEALKTLLYFETRSAVPLLKIFIRSEKERLRQMAIRLAGAEKVQEAVPALVEWLEQKKGPVPDTDEKISIVQALAQIADARAIAPLTRILDSRNLLFRGELNRLKGSVLESLRHYDANTAAPLLEKASRSKDGEVRALASRFLRTGEVREKRN